MDRDNSVVTARGREGGGEGKRVQGRSMVMDRDLTWDGDRTIQYTDDVL